MVGLEQAAAELAKGGRTEEWRELVAVLTALGLPEKQLAALRTHGESDLLRANSPSRDTARALQLLRGATSRLATHLPALADEGARRRVARQLLVLDADVRAAHVVLGDEWVGGRWGSAGEADRAARRKAMQVALQEARRLEVPVEVGVVRDQEIDALVCGRLGRPLVRARSGRISVLSAGSAAQAERILRQALRAAAVANFLATGQLQVPGYQVSSHEGYDGYEARNFVLLEHRADYEKVVDTYAELGAIQPRWASEAKQFSAFSFSAYDRREINVKHATLESEAAAHLLLHCDHARFCTPALTCGHISWVCRAFLGTRFPYVAYRDGQAKPADAKRTSAADLRWLEQRQELLRLADAGLLGGRTFLRFLAARREDPAWSDAMQSQLGPIQGETLLKATFVAEFLMESGTLAQLDGALRKVDDQLPLPERFVAALGEPLAAFEERWRNWLLGCPPGVVQRLLPQEAELPRNLERALRLLQALREQAFAAKSSWVSPRPVVVADVELGAGCVAHAKYLGQHPDMVQRWPDAHEENPEHVDWSAHGAWAGRNSVIHPGIQDGEAAVQGWMGTFYHRLPLLEPGLLRIGLGQAGNVVVMDSGSLVAVVDEPWRVAWPPEGAKGVPVRFVPELPNPVPGEDQSKFGYPITLQVGPRRTQGTVGVTMRLLDGGREVPCWFSSPQQPTFADLAPPGAFCLIPKSHLRPGTTYTVVVRFLDEANDLTWQFRT